MYKGDQLCEKMFLQDLVTMGSTTNMGVYK